MNIGDEQHQWLLCHRKKWNKNSPKNGHFKVEQCQRIRNAKRTFFPSVRVAQNSCTISVIQTIWKMLSQARIHFWFGAMKFRETYLQYVCVWALYVLANGPDLIVPVRPECRWYVKRLYSWKTSPPSTNYDNKSQKKTFINSDYHWTKNT